MFGVYAVTGAIVGYLGRDLKGGERLVIAGVGLAILCPWEAFAGAVWLNAAGLALGAGALALRRIA
jgi:hypothetical protein